ncbi:hypothetical protein PO878_04150 [Iamia majanohamensis]|uniref:Uncharacterized protein n=1 Tax=Iamia majanohamensis TaxID=467976 RepID=A0AAF0BWK2_9ACTN|nr:hypothetical protein [Iamia majanohamensis]WCO67915.1 hypothetical protein PO878_04150 [Iamia majanohamensis]
MHLSDEQMLLLASIDDEKIAAKVEAAKARLQMQAAEPGMDPALAGFVADVITEAKAEGRLVWQVNRTVRYCPVCETTKGYVPFKSGPRKGEPNLKRPCHLTGVELADRFVRIQGHLRLGTCMACMEAVKPHLVAALSPVKVELPDALAKPGAVRWVRHGNRRCTECGWEGHEGQMGREPTVFGDGSYPGRCPSCNAKNPPLGRDRVERVDGFTMVEATA